MTSWLSGPRAQTSRYLIAGACNTGVAYVSFHGVLALLHHVRGAPAAAQVVSTIVSTACAFALHRRWTYRSTTAAGPQATRFVVLQIGVFVFGTAAVEIAIDGFGLPPQPVWLVLAAIVVGINYVGQRAWVFRAPGTAEQLRVAGPNERRTR